MKKQTNTREIKVSANKSARTFTLRVDCNKYRTLPVSRKDFEEMTYNTPGDWENFLRTQNGAYYRVV